MLARRVWLALVLFVVVCSPWLGAEAAERPATYLIGRAKTDITGPPIGMKMMGYVRADQISEGIHLRQYARTFVVAQADGQRRLALVTTDLMSVTHSLVLSVLDKLKPQLGDLYRLDNVVIAATHTHAAPGGYWHYAADTPLGTPFHQEHYDALVEGIARSIVEAHQDLRPGEIYLASGALQGAGAQRSRVAYQNNPQAERERYDADTDSTQMTLLKFVVAGQPVGILNWHPVHPTSMSCFNKLISGDNKGYAEYVVEHSQRSRDPLFVAAFAQSNCGDVTPNLTLNQRGPGKDEFDSTRIIGQRQADAALKLLAERGERLEGPIDSRQSYIELANLVVSDKFTHSGDQPTSPAAYGYSFAAGSTEDGGGQPLFKEGMKRQEPLIDALARSLVPLPAPTAELRQLHRPKPILLAIGEAKPPVLPTVLPIGVARIGQLALVVGPAEYTTMSGRRFRDSVRESLPSVKQVVIAGYANDYAGYVATREEYQMQHYEGAATLYGPWTQAAYQQEFARLAADIAAGRPSTSHASPFDMRGTVRPTPLGTSVDHAPLNAAFGDVVQQASASAKSGESVSATFWTGNPQNGYRAARRYAVVERREGDRWVAVTADGEWPLKCRWTQPPVSPPPPEGVVQTAAAEPVPGRQIVDPLAAHLVSIEWEIPTGTPPGTYRLTHQGACKQADGMHEFEAHSQPFVVE